MEKIAEIQKIYHEENKSLRGIAAEIGCDFKTVQKYAYMDDFNIEIPIKQTRGKKLDPFKDLIDYWMEEDLKEHPKQRHTAKTIHRELKKHYPKEFDVSPRSVRTYVAEKKKEFVMTKKSNQGYIPLEHSPVTAQADFGEAYFIENGIRQYTEHELLKLAYDLYCGEPVGEQLKKAQKEFDNDIPKTIAYIEKECGWRAESL